MVFTDEDRLNILGDALDLGLRGTGGECGEAAVAINDLLFAGRGKIVAAVNSRLWNMGYLVGHVGVQVGDSIWDAEGVFEGDGGLEEFLAWGMVDPSDPDYDFLTEDEAYEVEIVRPTKRQLAELLPACGPASQRALIQRAIMGYKREL